MVADADDGYEPFVGRETELRALSRLAALARSGPSVVVISGRPGTGKTALVRRFSATLDGWNAVRVVAGANSNAFEFASSVVEMIERPARRRQPARDLHGMTTVQYAKELLGVFALASEARPAVVILENLDSADPESLEAIGYAARRLEGERLLLVLVGHDKPAAWQKILATEDWSSRPEHIQLNPLSREESVRLCEALRLPDPSLTAASLYARSEGNPLHLRSLIAGANARNAGLQAGNSLADALNDELDALTPPQQDLVVSLAVWGSPAPVPDLAILASADPEEAGADDLVERGILERQFDDGPVERLAFRSGLYQDQVYWRSDRKLRKQLHAKAAALTSGFEHWRHLVGATSGYDDELADRLEDASRGELGFDDARASQYLLWSAHVAAVPARRGRRYAEAVRLLIVASRDAEAIQYESAVGDLDASPYRTETLALLSLAHSRPEQARALMTRALTEATDAHEDAAIPRIETEQAYISSLLALGDETVSAAESALRDAGPASRLGSVAAASLTIGMAFRDGADAGLELTATLPRDPAKVDIDALPQLTQRGLLKGLTGDLDGAVADLSTVARRHATSLTRMLGISSHLHLVWCYYLLGHWGAAERALEIATDIGTHHGRTIDIGLLHSLAAILYAGRGERDRAAGEVETAERITRQADFTGPTTHAAVARAAIHQAEGDPSAVIRELRALEQHAEAQSDRARLFAVWWRPALIEAQIANGQFDQAGQVLERLAAAPAHGSWLTTARAWLGGRLAEASGDPARARRLYQAGIDLPPVGGNPLWYRALLQESYGSFLTGQGQHEQGIDRLNAATRAFDHMGALPFRDRCAALAGSWSAAAADAWSQPLTSKEREVGLFIGRGWTNREIADELYISQKTVEFHLGHIYSKLQLSGRRELRNLIHDSESTREGIANA